MTWSEYTKHLAEAYEAGRISAEAYDAGMENADIFIDDEEEEEEEE